MKLLAAIFNPKKALAPYEKANQDARKRIEKMEETVERARMNGEFLWFKFVKAKDDDEEIVLRCRVEETNGGK